MVCFDVVLVSGHCTSAEDVKSRVFDVPSSVTLPMHAFSPRTDHIENHQCIPKLEYNYRYETPLTGRVSAAPSVRLTALSAGDVVAAEFNS